MQWATTALSHTGAYMPKEFLLNYLILLLTAFERIVEKQC